MSIRELLLTLPYVVNKRLNVREGFFTAGRMFALLSAENVLLRLPATTGEAVIERDQGQPLVGPEIPSGLSWVSVSLGASDPDELRRLLMTSHEAVRLASRRRPRPGVRRRRRTRATA